MPKRHKVGEIYAQKDPNRPNGIRVVEYTRYGVEDARRVEYIKKYKDKDLEGYRILQLDMNPFNFRKDNLVKVSVLEMNLLLNNNLLAKTDDYKFNKKINKQSLAIVKNIIKAREVDEVLKDEK